MESSKVIPLVLKIALLSASGIVVLAIGYGIGNVVPIFNVEKECEKCEECEKCKDETTTINYPSYDLIFGEDSTITVPENWYVERMDVEYHNMTESEYADYDMDKGNVSALPAIDSLYLSLTNGDSTIIIQRAPWILPSGIGWESRCLEEGVTVVDEPTNTSDEYTGTLDEFGFARISEGGDYTYLVIANAPADFCYGAEQDYVITDGDNSMPFPWFFTFSGDEDDLPVADEIYRNSFVHAEPDIEME